MKFETFMIGMVACFTFLMGGVIGSKFPSDMDVKKTTAECMGCGAKVIITTEERKGR